MQNDAVLLSLFDANILDFIGNLLRLLGYYIQCHYVVVITDDNSSTGGDVFDIRRQIEFVRQGVRPSVIRVARTLYTAYRRQLYNPWQSRKLCVKEPRHPLGFRRTLYRYRIYLGADFDGSYS